MFWVRNDGSLLLTPSLVGEHPEMSMAGAKLSLFDDMANGSWFSRDWFMR